MALRSVAIFFNLLALYATCISAAEPDPVGNRPNVILLMGDDHGWDETGYNGHPYLQTPILDEMAGGGLRLDRFYSAHPSCSPTRASVMTGRHPNRCGTFRPGYSIRPNEVTIAHLLSGAGYRCGHFGKWHLGPVKAESPTNPGAMGFHHWVSHDNFFELDPWFSRDGAPPQQFQGESSQVVVAETIKFLDEAVRDGAPFLAVVWFGSPHEPYSGLPKDLALYDPAMFPPEYAEKQIRLTSNETGRPTLRPLAEVLQERYAEITAMDRAIGELRDWLTERGLRDNTVLWYCGDNGASEDGSVTSPFRGQKGTHYEAGVRVPGIIEWPCRITSPRVSDINAVTSDILPTVCDLTGAAPPTRPLDGLSLRPLIDGKWNERPEPIFFWSFQVDRENEQTPFIDEELQRGTTPLVKLMAGLRTRNFRNDRHPEITDQDYAGTRVMLGNRYKLILSGDHADPKRELFDVVHDRSETNDLTNTEHEVAESMEEDLHQWQQSVLRSLTGAENR